MEWTRQRLECYQRAIGFRGKTWEVLVLHLLDEKETSDIARLVGWSRVSVQKCLGRARRRMKLYDEERAAVGQCGEADTPELPEEEPMVYIVDATESEEEHGHRDHAKNLLACIRGPEPHNPRALLDTDEERGGSGLQHPPAMALEDVTRLVFSMEQARVQREFARNG